VNHRTCLAIALCLVASLVRGAAAAPGDGAVPGNDAPAGGPAPTADATRRQIDALIRDAADGRATLGLLQRAIDLSIAFGAPAWNAGDHDACAGFYAKTADSLCAAFDAPAAASGPARVVLTDLRGALDRVAKSADVDANAWTMRYVFDKATVAVGLQSSRSAAMVSLGQQCAARASFRDAADAHADAVACLRELRGLPVEQIPIPCRYAPLALGDALFALRKFDESAAAVVEGLAYIPDLATQGGDLRRRFGDAAMYKALVDDLKAAADVKPDDAPLRFLVGYHLYFTGQRDAAREHLERAQKLDPKLAAAERLLNPPAGDRPPPPAPKVPPTARPLPKNGDL
jgi:tetratricopeptide (TPR) repeat protein